MTGYPQTVKEIITDNIKFKKGVLKALKEFKNHKSYKLSNSERLNYMQQLLEKLSAVYRITPPILITKKLTGCFSGDSYYNARQHQIVMQGRLSDIIMNFNKLIIDE